MYESQTMAQTALTATPATLSSTMSSISESRSRISDAVGSIFHQLQRLGFYSPLPTAGQLSSANGIEKDSKERTATEILDMQANSLRMSAANLEDISNLLNNQF